MITVLYSQEFLRRYNKLSASLQKEIIHTRALFQERSNHRSLRVHKLKGRFDQCWSFSVNYSYRIVFEYADKDKNTVIFLTVGDHSVYD